MLRILNLLLLLSFLIGYLEWGPKQHAFIFSAEYDVVRNAFKNPFSVIHPFILLPFTGQILLLITIFQKRPNRILTLTGLACLSILIFILIIAGLLTLNVKILLSVIPFLFIGMFVLKMNRYKPASD